jgi:ABC-2 type transport system ATP-binding protein
MSENADAAAGPGGPALDGRPRAIEAEGLVKAYGETRALDGLDLIADAGRILAVLGPNGAGKTTAVRVLTTLTVADAGMARVAGHDVRSEAAEVRRHIGLAGQDASLDEYLTGQANLVMIGRLTGLSKAEATRRGGELLERFELTGAAKRVVKTYSGGMRRRLDLAASLIGRPDVVFLDEPTTGLDPRSRIVMWDIIRDLAAEGATLLLTTQYLEEADQLADRIAVVDEGRVIAEGSAADLKRDIGGERLQVVVAPGHDLSAAGRIVEIYASGSVHLDPTTRRVDAPIPPNSHPISHVARELAAAGIEIDDIAVRTPSLDDVFLTLTGHAAEIPGSRQTHRSDGADGPDGADGREAA